MAVSQPPSNIERPSSIFLKLFNSSFSVRTLDQPIYSQLCLAQQAVDNVVLARKLLVGLADIMIPEDSRIVERTIDNVEYNVRILEQKLGVLASKSSVQLPSRSRNRALQTADGEPANISKTLEDLSDAAGLLYSLLDSYSTLQSRVMLESKMEKRKSSQLVEEIAPYVATQTLQPNGLPAFDPEQLLHYRRKSRISLRRSRESFERHEIGLSSPFLPRSSLGSFASQTPRVMEMHELEDSSIDFENDDGRNDLSSNESPMWSTSGQSSTKEDAVIEILEVRSLDNPQIQSKHIWSLRPGLSAPCVSEVKLSQILPSQRPRTPQENKNTSSALYGSPHSTSAWQHPNSSNVLSTPASSSHTPRTPTTTCGSTSPRNGSSVDHTPPLSKPQRFSVNPNVPYEHRVHSSMPHAQALRHDLPTKSPYRAQGFERLHHDIASTKLSTMANAQNEPISTTSLPIRPVRKRNAWLLHQIDKAGYL